MAKVYDLRQEDKESPATFLERILEAFTQYTPLDPEKPENFTAVAMAHIHASAPDMRKKLQKIDRVGEKTFRDLMEVAEKWLKRYIATEKQKTKRLEKRKEERHRRVGRQQTEKLAKIMLAATMDPDE